MIDAANFKPQGRPTPAQVKAVYESMYANGKPPTVRPLHLELTKRGFSIGVATVGRYIKDDFCDLIKPGKSKPVAKKIAVTERAITQAVKKATTLKKMPGTEDGSADKEPSGIERAVAPPVEEIKLLARLARMKELMLKSGAEVAEIEDKTRRVFNIILMEEGIEIADSLIANPKDSSMMVVAQAEGSAKTTVIVADPTKTPTRYDPNDPNVIDHQATPPNALSASITTFLRKHGMEAA